MKWDKVLICEFLYGGPHGWLSDHPRCPSCGGKVNFGHLQRNLSATWRGSVSCESCPFGLTILCSREDTGQWLVKGVEVD